MLADTRRRRRLQNAHIGIFRRFSDLTCTSPQDLTYEQAELNTFFLIQKHADCIEKFLPLTSLPIDSLVHRGTPALLSVCYCNQYESHDPIWSCILMASIMAAISVHANLIQDI